MTGQEKFSMKSDIVISIEHLTKVYKIFSRPIDRLKEALHPFHKRYSTDFYALRDISLVVHAGETIGIIGKNGAGKSTLLKLITGVLTPTSGNIVVSGKVASLLELGAGFNPEMTGIENIYLNGALMGRTKEEMENCIDEIIAFADIGRFINQPVKTYSSGMFARLAFAVNAFVEPDILIVDEALAVGDSFFQIKCMEKMRALMDGGTAVLFVSHDINAVRRFCTRAIWMEQGEIRMIGETNKVADAYDESTQQRTSDDYDENDKPQSKSHNLKKEFAEILDVCLLDKTGREIEDEVSFDEGVKVEVSYEVRNLDVESPVMGIAIRSLGEDYVCGLNTLLDEIKIPWRKGKNCVSLEYPDGLLVPRGRYYFDIALFDQTATVPMHYMTKAKIVSMKPNYKGEGEVILPHIWHCQNRNEEDGNGKV